MTSAEGRAQSAERRFSAFCTLQSAFLILVSALPLIAATPVTKLPGIVDAGSWKRPARNPPPTLPASELKVFQIVDGLNQIPEDQLNDKSGPPVAFLEQLRVEDGPDYAKLKILLARADVRKGLGPGTKCLLAGLLSPRADSFVLAGNLWLAGLQSANSEFRAQAREHLVRFIQPAHIPVLIHLLKVPGPNVLAFEVLQEVTGQHLDPTPHTWEVWWGKSKGKVDVVGHMLNQSRSQLKQVKVHPLDPSLFWYLPEGVSRTDKLYEARPIAEQNAIGRWRDYASSNVKHFLEESDNAKPWFERIVHQPDKRVAAYVRTLVNDPGLGDYASVILAWRGDVDTLRDIVEAYRAAPTVGRALARGTLGDKTALQDLLKMIEGHKAPLGYASMDDAMRNSAARLPSLGILAAEQAFELLAHQRFGLSSAVSAAEKRKAFKKAQAWLTQNLALLTLDRKHGYYLSPAQK